MFEPSISLADAADRLGVHYMTAYRYVRTGGITAAQVDGRWRIAPSELDRFRHAPRPRPGRRGRRSAATVESNRVERIVSRLVAGDESGAWSVVTQRLDAGRERTVIVTELLVPAMRELGDRWEAGQVTVAEEHVASGVVHRVLARLGGQGRPRGPRLGTVVLASLSGERHGLPLAFAADVLRGHGLRVVDLGADTPVRDVCSMARAQDRLVGVGICATTSLDRGARRAAADAVAQVRAATDRPVLAGGAAIDSPEVVRQLGADGRSETLDDVVEWFVELAPRPRERRR